MQNYLCKESLDQKSKRYIKNKQVKDIGSTILYLLLSLSASFLIFFSTYFLGTTNGFQQAIALSNDSFAILVLWLFSIITGQRPPSRSERVCSFFKRIFFDWLAAKKSLYTKMYLLNIQIHCHFKSVYNVLRRQRNIIEALMLQQGLCQRYATSKCPVPKVKNLVISCVKNTVSSHALCLTRRCLAFSQAMLSHLHFILSYSILNLTPKSKAVLSNIFVTKSVMFLLSSLSNCQKSPVG